MRSHEFYETLVRVPRLGYEIVAKVDFTKRELNRATNEEEYVIQKAMEHLAKHGVKIESDDTLEVEWL